MPVDPNNWYNLRGMVNPFLIPDPWDSQGDDTSSLPAANKVASILHGKVIDNLPAWKNSGSPFPVPHRYTVQVNGINFNVPDLAQMLTNDSPDQLRVDLNRYGITVLGPPPLPAAVSYPSNYDINPLATDPGPVPSWAVSQAATATKPPITPTIAPVTGAIQPTTPSNAGIPGPINVTQGVFGPIPNVSQIAAQQIAQGATITPITQQTPTTIQQQVQQIIASSTPTNAMISPSGNIQPAATTQSPTSAVNSNLNQPTTDVAKTLIDTINSASNVWLWIGAGGVVLYLLFKE